ncbi:Putative fungal transcription factor [Septoria linicola]|uniref:Fungal transcription factor n=1 Tax=Septoria linicola TaxID=215465 RepID=A0A9Q9ATW4_9PEZI|nr:putative fungal transcription factor [Septoria linicola]USW51861.1 Putative fungal transcription factor [Septoria linicola]
MASVTGKRVLDFYSTRTSGFLACFLSATEIANPWYTEVMPLAIHSPMVRDSMLALGGSHLAHVQQNSAVQRTAIYHYAKAVAEVTPSIQAWLKGDRKDCECLFFAVALLAMYEHIAGDAQAMYFHVSAVRELARSLGLLDNPNEPSNKAVAISLELEVLTEFYSIFKLNNDEEVSREVAQILPPRLAILRTYSTFGYGLGVTADLFLLVPCIAMLALERGRIDHEDQTLNLHTTYITLQQKAAAWQYPRGKEENIRDAVIKRGAAKILQATIQTFLETAYWHRYISTEALAESIQPFGAAGILWLNDIAHTPVAKNLAWPLLILGASMRREEQRVVMMEFLKGDSDVALIVRVRDTLLWVWRHPDPDVYGMVGLERLSAETGLFLPI